MNAHLWLYADLIIWSLNAGLMWPRISAAGERAGWAVARHMLAVQRENDRLAGLQVEVMLLQLSRHTGGTYYHSGGRVTSCRRLSGGGYDW